MSWKQAFIADHITRVVSFFTGKDQRGSKDEDQVEEKELEPLRGLGQLLSSTGESTRTSRSHAHDVMAVKVAIAGGQRKLRKEISSSSSTPPSFSAASSSHERDDLDHELNQEVINLGALQRIAGLGLPGDGGLRALTWKLLLGYLPVEQHSWEASLENSRQTYARLKQELLLNPSILTREDKNAILVSNKEGRGHGTFGLLRRRDVFDEDHPLSLVKGSRWHQFFQDNEIVVQIKRDLLRTHPDVAFFSGESIFGWKPRESMGDILLLFAKLNPAIGYVQGMNEVLAPLFYVISIDPSVQTAGSRQGRVAPLQLHLPKHKHSIIACALDMDRSSWILCLSSSNAEADAFSCFVLLMSDLVDHFCSQLDNSPSGILSTLARMLDLLKINDEELWKHLVISTNVNPQFYAFRWITLLFTQEFDFISILRIWDSILGNPLGVQEMVMRIGVAMLLCVKKELLGGDFSTNLKLLQSYPEVDLEHLLLVAQELKPAF